MAFLGHLIKPYGLKMTEKGLTFVHKVKLRYYIYINYKLTVY